MRKVAVILNRRSGGLAGQPQADPEKLIADLFRQYAVAAVVRSCDSSEIAAATEECLRVNPEAIVAAGGDGTINAVANVLAERKIPLGIIPLGTYNHFAQDLGLPLDTNEAVLAICHGTSKPVDIAEVNGHFFVNNSSIGAYPHAVEERKRGETVWNKRFSMLWAALKILFRKPLIHVQICLHGREFSRLTPFVFIGNNHYSSSLRSGEHRDRLDSGTLCLFTVQWRGFFNLLKLLFQGWRGRLASASEFGTWSACEVQILTHKPSLRVAADGEVMRLPTPLRYVIHPGGLHVILPEGASA